MLMLKLLRVTVTYCNPVCRLGTRPRIRPVQCTAEQQMTWKRICLSHLFVAPQRAGMSQGSDATAQTCSTEGFSVNVIMQWAFVCNACRQYAPRDETILWKCRRQAAVEATADAQVSGERSAARRSKNPETEVCTPSQYLCAHCNVITCYCQSLQETFMSVGLMATCDCHVVPTGL